MDTIESNNNASLVQLFRSEGYPTRYQDNPSFLSTDITFITILSWFIGIWLIFLFISHGYSGREKNFFIIRVTIGLFVAMFILKRNIYLTAIKHSDYLFAVVDFIVIHCFLRINSLTSYPVFYLLIKLVCSKTPYWETASVVTLTRYRPESTSEMKSKVGILIGLQGFNVTFKEILTDYNKTIRQPIYYNERFTWDWASSKDSTVLEEVSYLKRQYRKAAQSGLPLPILWVLEYFTIDGENFRFGRYYQRSGWYSHTFLWLGLGCWALSICLFRIVIEYGSLFMMLTGLSLITGNVVFALLQNPVPLDIPFPPYEGIDIIHLQPDFSWAYWINLSNGLFCIIIGFLIYSIDIRYPDLTALFFGIDVVQNYDQYFQEIEEEQKKRKIIKTEESGEMAPPIRDRESKYLALRKKVASNRLSMLHRLTVRDRGQTNQGEKSQRASRDYANLTSHFQQIRIPETPDEEREMYYAVPKTVKVPVQPRVIGTIPSDRPVESFEIKESLSEF